MAVLRGIRAWFPDALTTEHSIEEKLAAVVEGMDNQSQLLNAKLEAVIEGINNQSHLINRSRPFDQKLKNFDDKLRTKAVLETLHVGSWIPLRPVKPLELGKPLLLLAAPEPYE